MEVSVTSLRALLRAHADPINAAGARRYFVDGVKTYGVHRALLDGFARDAVAALRAGSRPTTRGGLPAALRTAGGLHRSGNMDEAALAVRILQRFGRHLTPAHFGTFDRWVGFLNDWASCDSLCGQIIGPLVREHPALIRRLVPWARSRHRWRRRAAAVSLIPLARTGERLPEILGMADRLLGDADLMVQKGVGWLLKEATKKKAGEVVAYLVANRDRTTRLVLRYACENLSSAHRRRVLGGTP
ncbi:MAG: DNA alkylation repair protein [Candidatus Eisenbacteria bacterium]|uniref:DNA alkylation repair protein n=1 Tax=Eiseniibacteriota bacterium TaxID=2212470 RepID=A0A938BNI7_UNCEI|nr:DNA alkylation repair protein [Candidatus Eisenbacteria bacterium]